MRTDNEPEKVCKDQKKRFRYWSTRNWRSCLLEQINIEERRDSSGDSREPWGRRFSGWRSHPRYNEALSSNTSKMRSERKGPRTGHAPVNPKEKDVSVSGEGTPTMISPASEGWKYRRLSTSLPSSSKSIDYKLVLNEFHHQKFHTMANLYLMNKRVMTEIRHKQLHIMKTIRLRNRKAMNEFRQNIYQKMTKFCLKNKKALNELLLNIKIRTVLNLPVWGSQWHAHIQQE